MQSPFVVLEFAKIREKLASFCKSEQGKDKANGLLILPLQELEGEKKNLGEALLAIARYGCFPLDVSSDLSKDIALAEKGYVLSVETLERVAHDILTSLEVKKYFASAPDCPLLQEKAGLIPSLSSIEKDIHKVIAPDLSIYDNASPTLRHIRIAKTRLEKEMVSKLGFVLEQNKVYLSDATLTIKNGHYVLPVANSYKSKVKGIVQEVSSSGNTTFIEPELLLAMNNKMTELEGQEKEEIHRLLGLLSSEVAGSGDSFILLNSLLGYFDFLQAKALYCSFINGHIPSLAEGGEISLIGLRHPLLDQSKVVSNDFVLSPERKVIIISGPNAGGKTVALKTLGLAALMHECGLPVACSSEAILPYFKNIFLDIGDSQSLSDNLSTFSAHMRHLSEIASSVGGKDLVLLDEVGTGTSPKEGEAIAYGVVRFLLCKHCYALISSHFEGLKAYAMGEKRVGNACMLFDKAALTPTYVLQMGLPGESYGLSVARRYGVNDEILGYAKEYNDGKGDYSLEEAIAKLSALAKENADLKERNLKKEEALKLKEREIESKEKALSLREEKLLSSVETEKREILRKAREEVDGVIASLQSPEVKLHQAIEAKRKLDQLEERKEREESFSGKVSLGDYVSLPSLSLIGKISREDGNRITIITPEGMSFQTTKDRVVKTVKPIDKKVAMKGNVLDKVGSSSLSLQLNLIGMHVDEALSALDSYLDKCRVKGFKRVKIVHGFGSGALRNAVHSYLRAHPSFVASFELGGEYEGGGGATVVHLK
jgi:DNA mismatch repair protein MutS2